MMNVNLRADAPEAGDAGEPAYSVTLRGRQAAAAMILLWPLATMLTWLGVYRRVQLGDRRVAWRPFWCRDEKGGE